MLRGQKSQAWKAHQAQVLVALTIVSKPSKPVAYKQLDKLLLTGFVRVLEILESPGILLSHFPGLESPGKVMLVLESPGNLLN